MGPPLGGGGRGGVELFRDPARLEREPSRLDGEPHRRGHRHRVLGAGDGRVHEHAVTAELHRDGGVGGSAHAGVDDDGDGDGLKDDLDVVPGPDAQARADRGRLTRGIATVTIWAPEASMGSRMISWDEYLPVPTINRDLNSRPPSTSGLSMASLRPSDARSRAGHRREAASGGRRTWARS